MITDISHHTTIAEAWKFYTDQLPPAPEDYHAHQRAFYAAALCSFNIVFNSLDRFGPIESFNVIKACHDEAKRFAAEQIKLTEANPYN